MILKNDIIGINDKIKKLKYNNDNMGVSYFVFYKRKMFLSFIMTSICFFSLIILFLTNVNLDFVSNYLNFKYIANSYLFELPIFYLFPIISFGFFFINETNINEEKIKFIKPFISTQHSRFFYFYSIFLCFLLCFAFYYLFNYSYLIICSLFVFFFSFLFESTNEAILFFVYSSLGIIFLIYIFKTFYAMFLMNKNKNEKDFYLENEIKSIVGSLSSKISTFEEFIYYEHIIRENKLENLYEMIDKESLFWLKKYNKKTLGELKESYFMNNIKTENNTNLKIINH